jgi:hypothetical protein
LRNIDFSSWQSLLPEWVGASPSAAWRAICTRITKTSAEPAGTVDNLQNPPFWPQSQFSALFYGVTFVFSVNLQVARFPDGLTVV